MVNWTDILQDSFVTLGQGVLRFVPLFILAILILVVGWLVGALIGRWVSQLIKSLKIDQALESAGAEEVLARGGLRLNAGAFVGGLVKWFIIVVALLAALDILGLQQITQFLHLIVIQFLPNLIVAAIVLVAAALISEAMQKVVTASAAAAGIKAARFLGGLTKWAIWIFAILIALAQLNIGGELVNTLFTGVVAMLALAGGLAFGLGGRDAAARYIERARQDFGSHH